MADDYGMMSPEDSMRFFQELGSRAATEGAAVANLANQGLRKLASQDAAITTYNSPIAEMNAGGKPAVESQINNQMGIKTDIPSQTAEKGIVESMVKAPGGAGPLSITDINKGSIIDTMVKPQLAGPESQIQGELNPLAQEKSTANLGEFKQDLKDLLPQKEKKDYSQLYGIGDYEGIYSSPARSSV